MHHVYDRGNVGQAVFRDDGDRQQFLRRVNFYQDAFGLEVLAHCLMTTHFHLAPRTSDVEDCLSRFMHSLLTSYTRYFNDRWLTRGHLFQGRFGSRLCTNESDVRGTIRYIHMNPVEAGVVTSPEEWAWSSHRGYLAGSDPVSNVEEGIRLFGDVDGYRRFMAQTPVSHRRPPLVDLAAGLGDPLSAELIRGPSKTVHASRLRREFIAIALQWGHRRSAVARYLNRSPAAITQLLAYHGDLK